MVQGPDKNLPFEYGHVGPDGLVQRWLNVHGSMQWYIIQSRQVQKLQENFDFFRGYKNCRKLEKKNFDFLWIKKKESYIIRNSYPR